MNPIDKLADHVKKAISSETGSSPAPSISSPTPVMTGDPGPVGWGETPKPIDVPTQFRLYLDADFIPGTNVKPADIQMLQVDLVLKMCHIAGHSLKERQMKEKSLKMLPCEKY